MIARLLAPSLALVAALPAQDKSKPWYRMDYGPVLSTSIEGFTADNVGYKARSIDLGGGAGVIFDTELLRVVAMWTDGYLKLLGTPYDGGHGPIPTPEGMQVLETSQLPGWARNSSFNNPRLNRYGPLPASWARYGGFYLHGETAVLEYTVGDATVVREKFDRVEHDGMVGIARTLDCTGVRPGAAIYLADASAHSREAGRDRVELRRFEPGPGLVRVDRSTAWNANGIGEPSAEDYADVASKQGVTIRHVEGFGRLQQNGAPVEALIDGIVAGNEDEPPKCVFSDQNRVRFAMDLNGSTPVQQVKVYSWHRSNRARQRYTLYGHSAESPDFSAKNPAEVGWELVAEVDTKGAGVGGQHGSAVGRVDGKPLGKFRHLLFDARKPRAGTFYTEFDVYRLGQRITANPRRYTSWIALADAPEGTKIGIENGKVVLRLAADQPAQRVKIVASGAEGMLDATRFEALRVHAGKAESLEKYTKGGPRRWTEEITTKGRLGKGKGAYVVDTITVPKQNPWNSRLRFGAFDFLSKDSAVLSTWNGDVWRVDGLDDDLDTLTWRRIATGLHDPLGLKVVDGVIHTLGRDGITRLHDRNGDGEIDWFENFNNEVLVTRNFHEFAFDLQCDAAGNFYFAKGGPVRPGGRGFDEIVAHHGTIMRVTKDGSKLDVVATGLRAPNGIGVSPDGIMTTGDNQGTWMPACRLNWLPKPGMFTSCVDTSHMDPKPTEYGEPLCWFPMDVDNSGGGQCWITSDRWGPLQGELLHQSYGTCNLYLVLRQQAGERIQGGVAKFPLSFASSQMRARFHDAGDGQLYTVGFKGWQTRAAQMTAFQRVRYTGKPLNMPRGLTVGTKTIELAFSDALDKELAEDPESYAIEIWNYNWSQAYGSPEFKPSDPSKKVKEGQKNRDSLEVTGAKLGADGRTVTLTVEGIVPCMQMRINFDLESKGGEIIAGDIHNTVNFVQD